MNIGQRRSKKKEDPRASLRRLLKQIRKEPAKYLPERSVHALNAFFNGYEIGYGIHGSPIWPEIAAFSEWLGKKLFYPQDTGECWPRRIDLNSYDDYDSYQHFLARYLQFTREAGPEPFPESVGPLKPRRFDFFHYLYAMNLRPGMFLGSKVSVKSLAATISGYFKGKLDAGLVLTRDEKRFLNFERWLQRHHDLPPKYSWHCIVDMWNYAALDSVNCFFAYFDAYLTNYGKKPKGLDDLFVAVKPGESTALRRRKRSEMPSKVIPKPESRRWWRSPYRSKPPLIRR